MRVEAQQLIMSSVIRLFMTINFSSLYLYGAVATFVASPQPILEVHAARLLMLPLYPSKSYTLLEMKLSIR